jgi:hypothetical protein
MSSLIPFIYAFDRSDYSACWLTDHSSDSMIYKYESEESTPDNETVKAYIPLLYIGLSVDHQNLT